MMLIILYQTPVDLIRYFATAVLRTLRTLLNTAAKHVDGDLAKLKAVVWGRSPWDGGSLDYWCPVHKC